MKLLKWVTVMAFVVSASVMAMEGAIHNAQSQCCPGPPGRGPAVGGGGGGGGAAAEPAPPLQWAQGSEVDLNADNEDARRPDMKIDLMEEAKNGTKPIVLYVATASDDRRYQRAREACEELECCLFGNHGVATKMNEHFTQIRVNIEDLDSRTLRAYNIRAGVAPQVLIFDADLRRHGAFDANIRVRDFENALDRAIEANKTVLERRERQASR